MFEELPDCWLFVWRLNWSCDSLTKRVSNAGVCWRFVLNPYKLEVIQNVHCTWWRHQMETFSALLVLCEGSPVTNGFPWQRSVTWGFGVFFDLRLNIRLSKQSRRRWFEMPSRLLWRHSNHEPQSFSGNNSVFRSKLQSKRTRFQQYKYLSIAKIWIIYPLAYVLYNMGISTIYSSRRVLNYKMRLSCVIPNATMIPLKYRQ